MAAVLTCSTPFWSNRVGVPLSCVSTGFCHTNDGRTLINESCVYLLFHVNIAAYLSGAHSV